MEDKPERVEKNACMMTFVQIIDNTNRKEMPCFKM